MTPREKLELLRNYKVIGGTGSYASLLKEAKKYALGGPNTKSPILNTSPIYKSFQEADATLNPTGTPAKRVGDRDNFIVPLSTRQKLYKNISPVAYPLDELKETAKRKITGKERDYGYDNKSPIGPQDEDAWAFFLGLPQRENTISKSQYKPTISNDNSSYYTVREGYPDFEDIVLTEGLTSFEQITEGRKSLGTQLREGTYDLTTTSDNGNSIVGYPSMMTPLERVKYSKGKDEKGKYISIYDKYDFDLPLANQIGKPYEIYDRVYYTDEREKQILDEYDTFRKSLSYAEGGVRNSGTPLFNQNTVNPAQSKLYNPISKNTANYVETSGSMVRLSPNTSNIEEEDVIDYQGTPIFNPNRSVLLPNEFKTDISERIAKKTIEREISLKDSKKITPYIPDKDIKKNIDLSNITKLQEDLINEGFDVGPSGPDGKLGKNTTKALQRFLMDKNFDVGKTNDDGVLGKHTRNAINQYNKEYSGGGKSPYALMNKEGFVDKCEDTRCAAYQDIALEKFYGISQEERLKAGIFGDAWDRTKRILDNGGELLYSKKTGVDLSNRVEPGDLVNLMNFGSRYQSQAGDSGTHTGIIDSSIQHSSDKRPYVYILHNVSGNVRRNKLYLDNGKMEKSSFTLNEVVRPAVEGKDIITRMPNPDLNMEVNNDNRIVQNATKALNSYEIREKMMRHLGLDEEEYFSLAKSTLGIINKESAFGEVGKIPLLNNRLEMYTKQLASKAALSTTSIIDPIIKRGFKTIYGYDIPKKEEKNYTKNIVEKVIGRHVPIEESRGWGQIKFNTNFSTKRENTEDFLQEQFGVNRKNLNILLDNGENAAKAAMVILAKNYNRLKKNHSKEEALYLAIQQYNGYDLDREIAGKTRRQWGNERNLDYPNKSLDFIDIVKIKDNKDNDYITMADKLNLDPKVISNQTRLNKVNKKTL